VSHPDRNVICFCDANADSVNRTTWRLSARVRPISLGAGYQTVISYELHHVGEPPIDPYHALGQIIGRLADQMLHRYAEIQCKLVRLSRHSHWDMTLRSQLIGTHAYEGACAWRPLTQR
jgi:hypothetical protein